MSKISSSDFNQTHSSFTFNFCQAEGQGSALSVIIIMGDTVAGAVSSIASDTHPRWVTETFAFGGLQKGRDVFWSLGLECISGDRIVDKQENRVPICCRV